MFTFPFTFWSSSGPFGPPSVPNIALWADPSNASTITLNYISLGATGTGTISTHTITTSADLTSDFSAGNLFRIGGTDTYVVASITSTTITTVALLSANYTTQSIYAAAIAQASPPSGSTPPFVQATGSNQPFYAVGVQNGLNVIRFDNANQYLAATVGISENTVFMTAEQPSSGGFQFYYNLTDNGSFNRIALLFAFSGNNILRTVGGGSTDVDLAYATPIAWEQYTNYSTNSLQQAFINSVSQGSSSTAISMLASTEMMLGFPTDSLIGDMGEFITYTGATSSPNQALLENYLDNKWFPFSPKNVPNLALWTDPSDAASVTLNYISLGVTGTGTSGTSTVATSGDLTSSFSAGNLFRLGPTDTYVVSSITSSTITVVGTLSNNYVAQSIYAAGVSQINDKSGNGNNAVQATAADQPFYAVGVQNGLNVLRFNSSTQNIVSPLSVSQSTAFIVIGPTPISGNSYFYNLTDTGGFNRIVDFYFNTGTITLRSWDNGSANHDLNYSAPTTWKQYTNYTTNSLIAGYIDSSLEGSSALSISMLTSTLLQFGFTGLPIFLDMGETAVYSGATSAPNQALLEMYEQTKWGV